MAKPDYRSHTQLATVMRCQRQYHYRYVLGLRKRIPSTPLAVGSWGHTLLEVEALSRGREHGSLLHMPETLRTPHPWARVEIDPDVGVLVLYDTTDDAGEPREEPALLSTYPLTWQGAHQLLLTAAEHSVPDGVLASWTDRQRPDRWVPDVIAENMLGYVHHHRHRLLRERPLLAEFKGSVVIDGVQFVFVFDQILMDGGQCVLRDHKWVSQMPSLHDKLTQTQRLLYVLVANHAPSVQKVLKRKVSAVELDHVKRVAAPIPARNQDGSLSKRKISTHAAVYAQALLDYGMDPKATPHRDVIDAMDEKHDWFYRDRIVVSPVAVRNAVRDYLAADIQASQIDAGLLQPTRSITFMCGSCDFEPLCTADMYGLDTQLEMHRYEKSGDREETIWDMDDLMELQA